MSSKSLKTTTLILVGGLLVSLGLVVGFNLRGLFPGGAPNLSLLIEAQELLRENYIEPLPADPQLVHGMIRGMVDTLGDPYTAFVEPAAHELQADTLSGQYGGIGARISKDDSGLIRLFPFAEGPAARAGVLEGDILVAVDGVALAENAALDDVSAALRGAVGTTVQLTLLARESGEPEIRVTITRESFPLPSVSGFLSPDQPSIGIIVISLFSDKTPSEVIETYTSLTKRGAQAIVLDLRGNAGGILDAGVSVARIFLEQGVIVIEQRRGSDETIVRADTPGPASRSPLVVLIDNGTASTAEVVAGALQANGRAPLFGTRSLGKGSIQAVVELRDGSSLHITSARWLTPRRQRIDGTGLTPDHEQAPRSGDSDPPMDAAIDWLMESLSVAP